ncbi:MAG TPA: hypothetical protein VKF40_26035 [Burkholderiales bacterium]|nr:hypothetical protein [Burkholderiales bacterium]
MLLRKGNEVLKKGVLPFGLAGNHCNPLFCNGQFATGGTDTTKGAWFRAAVFCKEGTFEMLLQVADASGIAAPIAEKNASAGANIAGVAHCTTRAAAAFAATSPECLTCQRISCAQSAGLRIKRDGSQDEAGEGVTACSRILAISSSA